jgi:hypothetical protein
MVYLLEQCVDDQLVSHAKAHQLIEAILTFTVVESSVDWRGIALTCPRWLTEDEKRGKERAYGGNSHL